MAGNSIFSFSLEVTEARWLILQLIKFDYILEHVTPCAQMELENLHVTSLHFRFNVLDWIKSVTDSKTATMVEMKTNAWAV
jgi:hypothetical protein